MRSGRLASKRAVITGANRSIGRAIALLFAKEGADIAISYRSDQKGAQALVSEIRKLGGKAEAFYAEFAEGGVDPFFNEVVHFLDGVDLLVNNAAGYHKAPFLEMDPGQLDALFHIGVSVPMRLSQLAARQMDGGGVILNISAISGEQPSVGGSAHCTAKAALNMLTKSMALELKPLGIRVNGIAPGSVPYDPVDEQAPIRKFGVPEDIAMAALFLASNQADWLTGQTITVDGGESLLS